jgi:hypothetical protein
MRQIFLHIFLLEIIGGIGKFEEADEKEQLDPYWICNPFGGMFPHRSSPFHSA